MAVTPRTSLDNRTSTKRSSALISSSPPSSPAPVSKRAKTSTSTSIAPTDGPNANKENIPPFLDLIDREFSSHRNIHLRPRRETPMARRSDVAMDSTVTPPLTPSREDASMDDYDSQTPIPAPRFVPLQTPSRELNKLTLATPPSSPPTSLQARARALLRPTSGTSTIIGRDTERAAIFGFLNPFITSPSPSHVATSMYISGSPGTGKTALVASILASISDKTVRPLYINCMGLNDIAILWERILSSIGATGAKAKASSSSSLHRLEHVLATLDFKCILVLDELDTFGPLGLSSIFALPTRFSMTLRVIAISNDLAQNASTPTIAIHRPSLTLPFAAYNAAEMQRIIRARLALLANATGSENDTITQIIQPAALTLLVKKVSAQTGDIRYALQVLRRAVDLAFAATPPTPVGMKHVLDAVKRSASTKMNSPPLATVRGGEGRGPLDGCISTLGLQPRLVLITVLVGSRRSSHGFSLDDLDVSASLHPPSPSKTPKAKPAPRRSMSGLASSVPIATPSRLYALYTSILASCPSTPFEPVSRSEFTDLLGMLETASLISLPLSPSSFSLSSPLKGKGRRSSTGSGEDAVCLCATEEEVLRALLALTSSSTTTSSSPGVREQEIGRIWEREAHRIEKTLKRRGEEASKSPALAREEYL